MNISLSVSLANLILMFLFISWGAVATHAALVAPVPENYEESLGQRDVDDLYLHATMTAKTLSSLKRKKKELALLRRGRDFCGEELRARAIPVSCFEVLSLERKWQVLGRTQAQRENTWLLSLCQRRIQKSRHWEQLVRTVHHLDVPKECRNEAKKRIQDLRYQSETENPMGLFRRRIGNRGE